MKTILIILALALIWIGCNTGPVTAPEVEPPALEKAIHDEQGLVELEYCDLPNTDYDPIEADTFYQPIDADSIEMYVFQDKPYYHPVYLCHRINWFLGAYYHTGATKYLERAEKSTQKLISRSHMINNAAYLPYDYDYAVHYDPANMRTAPWYSGMAQGEFLGVLCRMYELTGKEEYKDFSHLVFRSIARLRPNSDIWVSRIDSLGYFWIEAFPHDEHPCMTLNCFMAAVVGLYDYVTMTNSRQGKRIWDACLTTLKHYLPEFRRPGRTSYYCLGHKVVAWPRYHDFHCRLLNTLSEMSGDPYFAEMSDLFESDTR
ncbi:MAG: hypothetical protein JSW34_09310 [Candidatus Zixiibacteriota bacterium]|nr:MAG: hypothetical protein JSW34_09310 [candidate division Zixibacteria bacterium]